MTIEIVAAVANGGVIGNQGDIPWRNKMKADMAHFRELTMGHIIVMGRKTWESLPERVRPLEGRANVVVSQDRIEGASEAAGAGWLNVANLSALDTDLYVAHDLAWLSEAAAVSFTVFVIGGQQIYEICMNYAERLHITHIDAEVPGDCCFPKIDMAVWEVEPPPGSCHEPDANNLYPYWFTTYRRRL